MLAPVTSGAQSRAKQQSIEDAFPEVDWLVDPFGNQVIVQMRVPKLQTESGLEIPGEARDYDRSVIRVGKVVAIGPLAFKKRDSLEDWPEGAWAKVGDFVRVPAAIGADSWRVLWREREVQRGPNRKDTVADWVHFISFNEYDLKGRIRGDPLAVVDYL